MIAAGRPSFRCALAFAMVATAGPVAAQVPLAGIENEFLRTQANPGDHDASYRYISSAVAGRDYEAAIGALEKLVLFNPGLARARYDLGALYFRLRSFEMAIRYFEDALANPSLEEELRRRIEILLPAARKELQPHRFYGVLQAGARYNSNVPGAPGFGPVRAYGVDLFNPLGAFRRPGTSLFVLGDVLYVYDFQNQRGDTWETRLSGAVSQQLRLSEYSAAFGEITTGPRLAIAPEALPGATIRPYVIGAYSTLGGARFSNAVGAGVSARFPVTLALQFEPGFEWRRIQVAGTTNSLGAQTPYNSGDLWTGSLDVRWSPLEWLTLDLRGAVRRNAAALASLSSSQIGLEASARFDFDAPGTIGWRWSATPFVRYADIRFDAADPFVDPWTVRHDRQLRVGAQFDMPITPMFGLNAMVQHTRNDSNIRNFRSTSWSALIGPTLRF